QSSELRIPSNADFIPKSSHLELIGTCNDSQSREHSLEIHASEKDSNKLVSEKKSKIPCLSINKCYEFSSEEFEENLESVPVANNIRVFRNLTSSKHGVKVGVISFPEGGFHITSLSDDLNENYGIHHLLLLSGSSNAEIVIGKSNCARGVQNDVAWAVLDAYSAI
ncbi:hypothetical protein TNCV_199561, partial [Trichonephila clavipes]